MREDAAGVPADADGVGLASNALVTAIEIIIARGEVGTGSVAKCDVVAAGCVANERIMTGGCVVVAFCVANERFNTGGRVVVANVLLRSALKPMAVLAMPKTPKGRGRLRSAKSPSAVLAPR